MGVKDLGNVRYEWAAQSIWRKVERSQDAVDSTLICMFAMLDIGSHVHVYNETPRARTNGHQSAFSPRQEDPVHS